MRFFNIYIFASLYLIYSPFSFSVDAEKERCALYSQCKECGDEKHIRQWSSKKFSRYGANFSIIRSLRKYSNEDEAENLIILDDEFFVDYGGYYLRLFIADEPFNKQRLSVIQYLLSKGVHPYEKSSSGKSLAAEAIIFNDVKGFQLMIDSGKLQDCKSELEILKNIATKRKKNHFINLIEKLIKEE